MACRLSRSNSFASSPAPLQLSFFVNASFPASECKPEIPVGKARQPRKTHPLNHQTTMSTPDITGPSRSHCIIPPTSNHIQVTFMASSVAAYHHQTHPDQAWPTPPHPPRTSLSGGSQFLSRGPLHHRPAEPESPVELGNVVLSVLSTPPQPGGWRQVVTMSGSPLSQMHLSSLGLRV